MVAQGNKLDRLMAQIANLRARADHPNTPPAEADLARERAERLMTQHRIEESSLTESEKAQAGIQAQKKSVVIIVSGSEFLNAYYSMMIYIVNHVGGKMSYRWGSNPDDGSGHYLIADIYGFESDIRYAEMLFNSAALAFGDRMEPKVDPALTDMENVYRLRLAGIERQRIAQKMWGGDGSGSPAARVTSLFKKACAAHGDNASELLGKGNSMKAYRENYARAFTSELSSRLFQLRQRVGMNSGQMVLQSRQDEINELFWTDHPEMRPTPAKQIGSSESFSCAKCEKAKSGYCRDHNYRKPRHSRTRYHAAAQERGRSAARSVDLGSTPTDRGLGR